MRFALILFWLVVLIAWQSYLRGYLQAGVLPAEAEEMVTLEVKVSANAPWSISVRGTGEAIFRDYPGGDFAREVTRIAARNRKELSGSE